MKGKAYNFGSSDHEPNPNNADRIELMKLARLARYCDYTCTFCFKTFPSAQALGGHQNAHKTERMEEKRLYVRDPIAYRRRIFLQSARYLKFAAHNGVHPKKYFNGGESSSMVAAAAMAAAGHGLGQRSAGHVNHHNLYHPYQKSDNEKPNFPLDLNLFPCNVEGERASMEVFNEAVMANANDVAFNGVVEDGNGIKCEKLDLTLKL